MNALNINSYHSPTKFLQPDYLHNNMISVQSTSRTCSSSAVTLARPYVSSSLQITTTLRYASPFQSPVESATFFVPSTLFCSQVYISSCTYHLHTRSSQHFRSHHLSLSRLFTPDLKLISFTNTSPIVFFLSFWTAATAFTDFNLYIPN